MQRKMKILIYFENWIQKKQEQFKEEKENE